MPDRIVIRKLLPADTGLLSELFDRNNRPEIVEQFHPFPLTADTAKRLATDPGLDRYYLATRGPRCIAFAMLRGWNEGYEVPSFGILVDYEHQGEGIGRRLATEVLEQAESFSGSVRLSVGKSNTPAISLYRDLGFRISEQSDEEGGGKIIMVKKFDER